MAQRISDTRRVSMYRSGRKIATAGDLRDPITLARSKRVPDTMSDDPVGFIQSIQPYANLWAATTYREKMVVEGTDVDETYVHLFYIRRDLAISIEAEDLVINDENEMYGVLTSRVLDDKKDWILIRTKYVGRTDGARFDNGALRGPNTTALAPVVPLERSSQAFWDQFAGNES